MISRTWHGIVPIKFKNEFEKYEYATGVKDSLATSKNRGAYLKVITHGDYAHFFLCTIWDDMSSVMAYAGDNPIIAVTYPEDEKYGLISDPIVIMQEIYNNKNPFINDCY